MSRLRSLVASVDLADLAERARRLWMLPRALRQLRVDHEEGFESARSRLDEIEARLASHFDAIATHGETLTAHDEAIAALAVAKVRSSRARKTVAPE